MNEPEPLNTAKASQPKSEHPPSAETIQDQQLPRIDGRYVLSELGSIMNFEKGILYTVREMLIRPGQSVRNFIFNDRNRLVKPILFIIICSLIYTLSLQIMKFDDLYINYSFDKDSNRKMLLTWVTENYGYANLLLSIFVAIWIKLLFRKDGYSIFEIMILMCFVIGTSMLIFALFGSLEALVNSSIDDIGALIGFIYMSWATGQFFSGNKIINFLKGSACFTIGLISMIFVLLTIGSALDWISS